MGSLPASKDIETMISTLSKAHLKLAKWLVIDGGELCLVPECINELSGRLNKPLYLVTNGTLNTQYHALEPLPKQMVVMFNHDHFMEIFESMMARPASVNIAFQLDISGHPPMQELKKSFERLSMIIENPHIILTEKQKTGTVKEKKRTQDNLSRYMNVLSPVSSNIKGIVI